MLIEVVGNKMRSSFTKSPSKNEEEASCQVQSPLNERETLHTLFALF